MADRRALLGELDAIGREFGIDVQAEVAERLARHYEILLAWNRRLNLTRIVEPAAAARLHFLESILGAHFINDATTRIIDIGSGAGFPGLPLAALDPIRSVILVEANTRRAIFLTEAARTMGLGAVTIRNERFDPLTLAATDIAVARAVDRFEALIPGLVRSPAKQVVLWGDGHLFDLARQYGPDRTMRLLQVPGSEKRYIASFDL